MIQKLNQADVVLGGGGVINGTCYAEDGRWQKVNTLWLRIFVVRNFSYLEIVDILFIVSDFKIIKNMYVCMYALNAVEKVLGLFL